MTTDEAKKLLEVAQAAQRHKETGGASCPTQQVSAGKDATCSLDNYEDAFPPAICAKLCRELLEARACAICTYCGKKIPKPGNAPKPPSAGEKP